MKKPLRFLTTLCFCLMLLPQSVCAQATYTASTGELDIPAIKVGDNLFDVTFSLVSDDPVNIFTLSGFNLTANGNAQSQGFFNMTTEELYLPSLDVVANGATTNYQHIFAKVVPDSNPMQFIISWNNDSSEACWDNNDNASCDVDTEDTDLDGVCTIFDCQGVSAPTLMQGPTGPQGPQGAQGPQGENWDTSKIGFRLWMGSTTAECNAGEIAIAGGPICAAGTALAYSIPSGSGQWSAKCRNLSTGVDVTPDALYVMCVAP